VFLFSLTSFSLIVPAILQRDNDNTKEKVAFIIEDHIAVVEQVVRARAPLWIGLSITASYSTHSTDSNVST